MVAVWAAAVAAMEAADQEEEEEVWSKIFTDNDDKKNDLKMIFKDTEVEAVAVVDLEAAVQEVAAMEVNKITSK